VTGSNTFGSLPDSRLAAAPISWGVCEVPGWGAQLPPERVLGEIVSLGLRATEAGPVGYLGTDRESVRSLLARYELRLLGGFLPVVLHERDGHPLAIAAARGWGATLAAAGATFLVSALVVDLDWSPRVDLSSSHWSAIAHGLALLDETAAERGLTHVVHPHWGTLVQTRDDTLRLLERSESRLCLDTGHAVLADADPVELVRAAGERIAHVHVKDVDEAVASRLRSGELELVVAVQAGLFRPLGLGDAPVGETVRALEERGYDGWYVLEQDTALPSGEIPPGEGPIEDVRHSIEFMQSVVATEAAIDEGKGVR